MKVVRRSTAAAAARDLAGARRTILRLQLDKARLQARVDRLAGHCNPPCRHELELEEARSENRRLEAEHGDVYRRMRTMLAGLQDLRAAPDGRR